MSYESMPNIAPQEDSAPERYPDAYKHLAEKMAQDTLGSQAVEDVFARYGMQKGEYVRLAYYGDVEVVAVDVEAQGVIVRDAEDHSEGLPAKDFLYLSFLGSTDPQA